MNQMKFRWPKELIVDLFAGGGGASVGLERALNQPVDVAINHWRDAIRVHEVNHPHTCHHHSDVWEVDPKEATGGQPVGLLWASPDCTFFSKARGSKPIREKGKQIRALAWVIVRWAEQVSPRVIMLENVEEFAEWGPVDDNGRPVPTKKGHTYRRWKRALERLGYAVEAKTLRACDYGAPTTRRRLFIIARRDGLPIVWPEPTHGEGHEPYRPAHEIIDWSIPCPSIFTRKRPLAEATLRRIARGTFRYVIDCPQPFIVRTGHARADLNTGDTMRGQKLDRPLSTVTKLNDYNLVTPYMIPVTHQGDDRVYDPREPIRTITSANRGEIALVAAFLARHWGGMTAKDLREPMPTVTKKGCQDQVVQAMLGEPGAWPTRAREVRAFLIKYFGTAIGQSLNDPAHTLTAKLRFGLVTVGGQDFQIYDIGMRMLTPRELFNAQGFPPDYQIDVTFPKSVGAAESNPKRITKTNQIALAGNAVCPPWAEALARANVAREAA